MDGPIFIKNYGIIYQRRPERKTKKPGEVILKNGRADFYKNLLDNISKKAGTKD
jgi:hypothetical protein